MSDEPVKYGVPVLVPKDILEELWRPDANLVALLSRPGKPLTDEQRAEFAAKAAAKRQAIQHRHEQLIAAAPLRLVADLLDLHGPKFSHETSSSPTCEGCDPGAYAEDSAEFPCATYERIAEALGGQQ